MQFPNTFRVFSAYLSCSLPIPFTLPRIKWHFASLKWHFTLLKWRFTLLKWHFTSLKLTFTLRVCVIFLPGAGNGGCETCVKYVVNFLYIST